MELQRRLGLERLRQEMHRNAGIDPVYQFEKHDDTATADELARENKFGSGKATADQLRAMQNQMERQLAGPQPPFGVEPEPHNINRGGRIAAALGTAKRHGGAVKATKVKAHYRLGHNGRLCGKCDMFRAPASCTAVEGKIRTQDTCDFFEKRK
jgi:hypothetical protein